MSKNTMAFSHEAIELLTALLRSYIEDSKGTQEPEEKRDLAMGLMTAFEAMKA